MISIESILEPQPHIGVTVSLKLDWNLCLCDWRKSRLKSC